MREAVYERVYDAIDDRTALTYVQAQFPSVSYDTLLAIWSVKYRQHSMHVVKTLTDQMEQQLFERYQQLCAHANPSTNVALGVAVEVNMPPYLLVRALLQQVGASVTDDTGAQLPIKTLASRWMDDPAQIPHERLRHEVPQCLLRDQFHSPDANVVRRLMGKEYEFRLHMHLRNRKIPFADEDVMRSLNYEKTPDALLLVPCAVNGRVVHWIESKAAFADRHRSLHRSNVEKQFLTYYNRYGCGLVIYWHGFVDELNTHEEFLLVDHFPTDILVLQPSPSAAVRPFMSSAVDNATDDELIALAALPQPPL